MWNRTASGLFRCRRAVTEACFAPPPVTTALGALLNHITGGHIATEESNRRSFQSMNINFGLFPPVDIPGRKANVCMARKRH